MSLSYQVQIFIFTAAVFTDFIIGHGDIIYVFF